ASPPPPAPLVPRRGRHRPRRGPRERRAGPAAGARHGLRRPGRDRARRWLRRVLHRQPHPPGGRRPAGRVLEADRPRPGAPALVVARRRRHLGLRHRPDRSLVGALLRGSRAWARGVRPMHRRRPVTLGGLGFQAGRRQPAGVPQQRPRPAGRGPGPDRGAGAAPRRRDRPVRGRGGRSAAPGLQDRQDPVVHPAAPADGQRAARRRTQRRAPPPRRRPGEPGPDRAPHRLGDAALAGRLHRVLLPDGLAPFDVDLQLGRGHERCPPRPVDGSLRTRRRGRDADAALEAATPLLPRLDLPRHLDPVRTGDPHGEGPEAVASGPTDVRRRAGLGRRRAGRPPIPV
ncbi:MAG: GH43_30 / GH43 / GH43_3, partial [uncultured Nocardioides sp.]